MRIFNTNVYGLEESIVRSGYPMSTEVKDFNDVYDEGDIMFNLYSAQDINRAEKLGNSKAGSGHDCFLKGIIVQADFEAPQYFWQQFQRYHFADIISSQSKMHRIVKMDLDKQCNKYVDKMIIKIIKDYIRGYNTTPSKENFNYIISNLPMGLNLTAGITTNYLQLKTMYNQRKYHKMEDWSIDFVKWCESLPFFKELCLQN